MDFYHRDKNRVPILLFRNIFTRISQCTYIYIYIIHRTIHYTTVVTKIPSKLILINTDKNKQKIQ